MARKKFDIVTILESLSKARPVFHKEADFQLALAKHIVETVPGAEIRLEWKPFPEKLEYLDMWILSEGIAVELKYKTRALTLSSGGEKFALTNHFARDQARLQDRSRLLILWHNTVGIALHHLRHALPIRQLSQAIWKLIAERIKATHDAKFINPHHPNQLTESGCNVETAYYV